MLNTNEAAFLRSVALDSADNAPRLVFADWLEEQGETARAEFVRVQCELTSSTIPEERRHAVRVRERELLNAHRQKWCQAFGLPIEDVSFERGLINGMRLSKWDDGNLLDPVYAPRFATLTELDLSGLALGDAGLMAFAKRADFPALRKLILSNNDITDEGATALASAAGMPHLETIYLFGNPVSASAQAVLEGSDCFVATNLDVGHRAEGYSMSPGEAEMARRQYVRTHLLPIVFQHFERYPRLQSAMLCVAQYWADEADDAVHGTVIVSELFEPTLKGVKDYSDDPAVDPNVPNTHIKSKYSTLSSSAISLWETEGHWDDNSGAIPLWAAFAPENGSQEYESLEEVYLPAVMFYRHGGYKILPMARPHLDGIRPEWDAEG
jgi:uncharacterized protein (TIGR02996 family)